MGTGGSGNLFSRKTELVADLTSAFKKLNTELEKTKQLSADIAKNIKGSFPGGVGGSQLFDTSNHSTNTNTPAQNDGSQGGGIGGINLRSIFNVGLKGAGLALQAMPSVQQAFTVDTLRSQFGFYGGQNAYGTMNRMAAQGTTTDPLDAARAAMTGATQGLLPGLKNFNTVAGGAATFSNLMPGVGLAGGMQAMAALNQGRNVNMLKMIGINVRGADGLMKGPDEIVNQLWASLNRQKTGGGAISKQDLALSLQPGNALASMMDQYFGNDPILRQGVIAGLMAKASGKGLSKQELLDAGAITSSTEGVSKRNAAALKGIEASAAPLLKGFDAANAALTTLNEKFAQLVEHSKALQAVLTSKGFLDTMATGGNGAMGAGMGGIGSFLGSLLGGKLGGKAMTSGMGNILGGLKGAFGKGAGFLGKAAPILGALLSGFHGFGDEKEGKGIWAELLKEMGMGAVVGGGMGAFAGGVGALPGALAGSLVAGGGYLAGRALGGGEGGNDPSNQTAMPLNNNPPITSPFGKVRYIKTNQGRNASWGKPHGGVDYGAPVGTPVYAVKDGVVQDHPDDPNGFGTYGKIEHSDGRISYYGHLSSLVARPGDKISAGDLVGYSGNSGNSSGPHLHFEVRDHNQSIDPLNYISGASDIGDETNISSAAGEIPAKGSAHPIHGMGLKITGGAGELAITSASGGPDIVGATGFTSRKARSEDYSVNYGGINVTMNFPEGKYNKQEIKQAVTEALSEENLRKHAVSK
jgi:hypothetical protein